MDTICLDTETLRWSEEVDGGWKNIQAFGLAVAVTDKPDMVYVPSGGWDGMHQANKWFCTVSRLEFSDWLNQQDRIISFNAENFDFAVMASAGFDVTAWKDKSFDILARFHEAAGHRISLENLAYGMFGEGKQMSGDKAVDYWRHGLELMSEHDIGEGSWNGRMLCRKVIDYCRDDVRLTRKIYEKLVEQEGELTYLDTFRSECRTLKIYMD